MTTRVAPKLGCHRKLLLRVAGVIAVSLPVANFSQSLAQSAPANPAAMAADTNPEFEVATIKPAKPGGPVQGITINGRQFLVYDTALLNLIGFAYGVQREEIVGAPEWASSEKYDVSAEQSAEGQPTLQQWKTMVQKLLADRFELKFHREKRELTVYALVLGKDGPKLTKSSSQSSLPNVSFHPSGEFRAQNETMENFAGQLQGTVLGRPVVDQTGFEGRFDFTLQWTPDETQFAALGGYRAPAAESADAPPDLFAAIQEQLGLKMESKKASVDVLVIDHAERPSAN